MPSLREGYSATLPVGLNMTAFYIQENSYMTEKPLTFWTDEQKQKAILEQVERERIYLNQSRAQLFHNCHRKFYWWDVCQLEPDRPRWALDIGTSVHLGLALLGSGKTIDEAVAASRDKLQSLMPAKLLPGDEADLEDNKNIVSRLLIGYDEEYSGGKTTWIPIAQETKGAVEVGDGSNVILVFRTDKLATWNNRLWIVDHKTAGRLDLRDFNKYEMALQFTAYTYAITKFTHQRVAGIIIDVLVKTKIPQYARDLKTRSDKELLEFEGEFVEVGKEIAWRKARVAAGEDPMSVFYKNTDDCFRYGTCPYRELCLEDTPVRRSLYKQRSPDYVDDPLTRAVETLPEGR